MRLEILSLWFKENIYGFTINLTTKIIKPYLEFCISRPSASAEIDWVGNDDNEDDFWADVSFALDNFDFVRLWV